MRGGPSPLRAIARVICNAWVQRYRRTVKPDHVTLTGVRLQLDRQWATPLLRDSIYAGWYEHTERRIVERTLRPDDRYLEIGAGIGVMTTCACRIVGAENVFVYEADPAMASVAAQTALRNGFEPTVTNAVLTDRAGEIDFYVHADFWTSSLTPTAHAVPVRVATKSFRGELRRVKPSYLMIDIEGGEIDLLGDWQPPAHVRALCVEMHPAVVSAEDMRKLLLNLVGAGFTLDLQESASNVAFFWR